MFPALEGSAASHKRRRSLGRIVILWGIRPLEISHLARRADVREG